MNSREAARHLKSLVLKPGWRLEVEPQGPNYVYVNVIFPARNTSNPPDYNEPVPTAGGPSGTFESGPRPIYVADCQSFDQVQAKLLNLILNVECHEWREYMRQPSRSPYAQNGYEARFHPHRRDSHLRFKDNARLVGLQEAMR